MIDPEVRRFDPAAGDGPELERLEAAGRAALVGQRGGDRWLEEHPLVGAAWHERAAAPGVAVFVAHVHEVPVGYLVAEVGTDHIVRVDQVWVDPEARENGFGDALLAAAIEWGRDEGAVAVEGQALPGDRHTKNLYERAGIVARLITTYRPL